MSPRQLQEISSPGFKPVPRTGVIYVMTEAARLGYDPNNKLWANLGQGAPETFAIDGAPQRINSIEFTNSDLEYAPIDGLPELRDAVAELYDARFRVGKSSKYTRENVAICSGGRTGLTRVVSTLGRNNIGHFIPDYTAYEELLDCFSSFVPIPILLEKEKGYTLSEGELRNEILGLGLSALLFSNPSNPTGRLIAGDDLKSWVGVARELGCTLIADEFYSHYLYNYPANFVSAAQYVENVDSDPLVIIDGLTKNWRYPGFRISWIVAPKQVIEGVASAGSFLDGGCARPMQLAALKLVNREVADKEAKAIQSVFSKKRELMLEGLKSIGVKIDPEPQGAFYCWGDISELPDSINEGMTFFRRALEHKVITVPGVFFDINPGQRRARRPSRFRQYVRFSFGPTIADLETGLASLKRMVA